MKQRCTSSAIHRMPGHGQYHFPCYLLVGKLFARHTTATSRARCRIASDQQDAKNLVIDDHKTTHSLDDSLPICDHITLGISARTGKCYTGLSCRVSECKDEHKSTLQLVHRQSAMTATKVQWRHLCSTLDHLSSPSTNLKVYDDAQEALAQRRSVRRYMLNKLNKALPLSGLESLVGLCPSVRCDTRRDVQCPSKVSSLVRARSYH